MELKQAICLGKILSYSYSKKIQIKGKRKYRKAIGAPESFNERDETQKTAVNFSLRNYDSLGYYYLKNVFAVRLSEWLNAVSKFK